MCHILPYTQCIINDNIGVMVVHITNYVYYIAHKLPLSFKNMFSGCQPENTVKSKNLIHTWDKCNGTCLIWSL